MLLGLKRRHASQAAGFVAVMIAAAALIGWSAGQPLLSSWGSAYSPVKPVAALCLAAVGLALIYPGKDPRLALTIGLVMVAVAALDLAQNLLGIDLGIEHWLVPEATVPGPAMASFRMRSATALSLLFAGASLALCGFERQRVGVTALGGIAGAIAAFALISGLTGIDTLYDSVRYRVPPLATAIGLLCIISGIILRRGMMPALRTPRPLWHLLVMLGCAIIAPLLLFGAYAGFRLADAHLDQVRAELMSQARTVSANVDREIIGEIERLQALAASASLRQGDLAEFRRQAEASLAVRRSGNIVLIDRDMQQLVNTAVPPGTPLPKAVEPESIERAIATGKPQVTGRFLAPGVKEPLVGIIVPVESDGETRYVVARSPDEHALTRLVAANELPPGWRAVVSDAAHQIIARSEHGDTFIGKELPPAQWHRAGPGSTFEFIDRKGRPSLAAYTWSELTGWETAVRAPKALLEAPAQALWWTLGLLALLALTLVIALASWLGGIISRSVGHAAQAAIAPGEGTSVSPSGTPVAEVNALMAELRARTNSLRESEATFRAMFDFSSVAKVESDYETGRFLRANAVMCKFVGYSEAELRDRTVFDITHPDERERDRALLRRMVAGLLAVFDMEKRYVRKDGEVVWARTTANIIRDRSGRPLRYTVVIQDITERKKREEQVHLLMREVNHRAKNMLSVVDAIAHQTATGSLEDFVDRFSERIQALSANQDLLVRNEWQGVGVEDLVRAQLAHFADLIGSRIAVHGPKLRLKAASAQAIGLALHELATNAGKYGALSTDTGRLDICWGTDGDTFTMGWTERDGPPVSAPKRRGFGTVVMEAMTERSLDGTVDLDYAPSGLTWRLTCSVANALEPGEAAQ